MYNAFLKILVHGTQWSTCVVGDLKSTETASTLLVLIFFTGFTPDWPESFKWLYPTIDDNVVYS